MDWWDCRTTLARLDLPINIPTLASQSTDRAVIPVRLAYASIYQKQRTRRQTAYACARAVQLTSGSWLSFDEQFLGRSPIEVDPQYPHGGVL